MNAIRHFVRENEIFWSLEIEAAAADGAFKPKRKYTLRSVALVYMLLLCYRTVNIK